MTTRKQRLEREYTAYLIEHAITRDPYPPLGYEAWVHLHR